jgi:predicted Zn finger-like uncharacterized protein
LGWTGPAQELHNDFSGFEIQFRTHPIGGAMNIVCKQCNASYKVPESKLPDKRFAVKCKKCGYRILVEPGPLSAGTRAVSHGGQDRPAAKAAASVSSDLTATYPELESFSPDRFDLAAMFTADKKGRYKSRKNKFKLKILTAVAPVIEAILEDGERVRHIAWGTAYYPLEIFIGNGWLTTLYNRYALAATDRRLLMIHTDHRMKKPGHYRLQMRYEEIRKVGRGLFRTSLALTRKKGKGRIFTALKPYLSREIHEFVEQRIDPQQPAADETCAYENLCPACNQALPAGLDACSGCGAEFKAVKRAVLRSLVLPGWGDIYLGHRMIGVFELLGSLLVWLVVFQFLSAGNEGVILGLFLLCFFNGMDALLTWNMAKKGYILEKDASAGMAPQAQTAGLRA